MIRTVGLGFCAKTLLVAVIFLSLNSFMGFCILGGLHDHGLRAAPIPGQDLQGVGYLLVDGGFCNVAYLGGDTALTNHHCVENEEQCEKTRAYFMVNGIKVSYPCTKLIFSGPDNKPHNDFSLIRLGDDPMFEIDAVLLADHKKLKSGKEYKLKRIKYDPPVKNIRIDTKLSYSNCEGNLDEKELSWVIKGKTETEPCHTVRGNSGGLIVDDTGKLVGLTSMLKTEKGKYAIPAFNDYAVETVYGPSLKNIFKRIPNLHRIVSGEDLEVRELK